jgi:hypothetical protein
MDPRTPDERQQSAELLARPEDRRRQPLGHDAFLYRRARLAVTRNGRTRTDNLAMYVPPPPDVFNVVLPVSITDGVPSSRAGKLETTSSEDDDNFTTTAPGGVQLGFSSARAH